ncbi:cytochrome c biogenesis protein ResB [Actinobacteria bacterium YIM 96077]|uniref:Cytochrome c biogenesis protein ResB n=1 Tax=Phytoactinopolyspora halophila TaxID=1981511 RepID=A0A329QKV9_9ACTN|nr:cytochrome c biogenesis protein ResB [Phytoactinopolyspora halophila]AYY14803.1 cytochrome c biogenesis protein ResB [Actinobacteria bacterium YIM 96077]RAW13077.1 cytochrome c biogenesis protein ResB [Phytoactinopolyspora halophila]
MSDDRTSGRDESSAVPEGRADDAGQERPETSVPGPPPALRPGEFLRWAWRQFTSMRVALILLFLLAVAAIPGSVVPQADVDPVAVRDFRERNPELSEWYDRLGLFDVFSAPWFAAIYLALLVSLVGCILPRSRQHWKAMRMRPPRAPRRLSRMPAYRTFEVDADPDVVTEAAHDELRSRRFRMAERTNGTAEDDAVGGEAGHLHETGNLVFHLSLVVVLLAVAVGGLFGYRGTVIVPEGSGFANTVVQYDNLTSGALFDPADLPPFTVEVEEFAMEFVDSGQHIGQPSNYDATVSFVPEPGAEPERHNIRVNEPLNLDGTLIHILNPGYAPKITVRSAEGEVLAEGPVPFLPQDESFTSTGVVKVPRPDEDGPDLGIEGVFLPTGYLDDAGPRSIFPEPRMPQLYLTAFHGDLGLDDGTPQSIYRLEQDQLEQFDVDGEPFAEVLGVDETVELPGDGSTVTFDGYVTWVNLQISRDSGREIALAGAVVAVAGLLGSLYVRRRRLWVRARATDGGRTVVEVAGLNRSEGGANLDDEVESVVDGLRFRLGEHRSDEEH